MGKQEGFTIIETIVAIAVFSIFFTFLMQGFIAVQTQRVKTMRYAEANNLAGGIIGRYREQAQLPGGIDCSEMSGGQAVADLTRNSHAPGKSVTIPQTLPEKSNLPSTTSQRLLVFYPQGCLANAPILIKAEVRYETETVVRAAYIN